MLDWHFQQGEDLMSNIFDYCDNIRKIPLTALIFSSDNIDIDINVTTLRPHLDADIEL